MSRLLELVREDLRDFAGYRSARSDALDGEVWLNANESPWPNTADGDGSVRRYPEPQPQALRTELAALYGCASAQLLIGRGSDEAIDLLVRAFCAPGRDAVMVTPPVFGMYAVCARMQGARLLEVAARDEPSGWRVDLEVVAESAIAGGAKLVFLCSPGNPTGELLPLSAIAALARKLDGRALVVVDEAYADYADASSATLLLDDHDNLAVLRTMSKAHALAAARIGCLIANPDLIAVLRRCQAPYPVPAPCAELALRALSPNALARTSAHVGETRLERERLRLVLSSLPGVRRVYGGQGNFLLVRFDAAEDVYRRLLAVGIVVRDLRTWPRLGDALRITIGTTEQNNAVIAALSSLEAAA